MIPWFQYTVIRLGPIPIQVWGSFVALGMLISIAILWRRSASQRLVREQMVDVTIWMIIGGLVGARLAHVFLYEPAFYLAQPVEMLKIWHGGLSSFGGLGGAVVAFFVFARRKKLTREVLWRMSDLLAFASVYGWMVGRLGCVAIHDHMGRPCDCFLAIQSPDGPRLEMAMLEIMGMIPLAILFFLARKQQKPAGWFVAILFLYYGVLRFILDFFRATDIAGADTRYLGLTPAQYFAIVLVVFGLFICRKKK